MRGKLKGRRPSAALIVAIVALVMAVAGTAAAGVATLSVLTKEETKQVKKIARTVASKQFARRVEPLKTRSSFNEKSLNVSVYEHNQDLLSTTLTTKTRGRVFAAGSVDLAPGASEDNYYAVVTCRIAIDGVPSLDYSVDPVNRRQLPPADPIVVAVNFARTLPAGTHTATLQCSASHTVFSVGNAAISAWAVGA